MGSGAVNLPISGVVVPGVEIDELGFFLALTNPTTGLVVSARDGVLVAEGCVLLAANFGSSGVRHRTNGAEVVPVQDEKLCSDLFSTEQVLCHGSVGSDLVVRICGLPIRYC